MAAWKDSAGASGRLEEASGHLEGASGHLKGVGLTLNCLQDACSPLKTELPQRPYANFLPPLLPSMPNVTIATKSKQAVQTTEERTVAAEANISVFHCSHLFICKNCVGNYYFVNATESVT